MLSNRKVISKLWEFILEDNLRPHLQPLPLVVDFQAQSIDIRNAIHKASYNFQGDFYPGSFSAPNANSWARNGHIENWPNPLPPVFSASKEIFDPVIAFVVLFLLSPLFLMLGLIVKVTSKGPVFYVQERIGKGGKPFKIFKFRSMFQNAELVGPLLSTSQDPRVTKFGRFMRKTRLDELPQFYNVLIGDMSIIGPRPERQYYIDQIVRVAPHYKHLLRMKPGITSLGQVKFGYAENISEMVERLHYDIQYIRRFSVALDIHIILETIKTVLQRKGQ
jgi:lipopolysaccharide/colanic/teichoic acid biosynthesis glycosyltransferase